jgi:hypothetical protein
LITAQRRGEPMPQRIERYNRDFALSYSSWFESVYKDKYEYMGEWDLMSLAFRLDLGLYYLGIVSQPFKLVSRRCSRRRLPVPYRVRFFISCGLTTVVLLRSPGVDDV